MEGSGRRYIEWLTRQNSRRTHSIYLHLSLFARSTARWNTGALSRTTNSSLFIYQRPPLAKVHCSHNTPRGDLRCRWGSLMTTDASIDHFHFLSTPDNEAAASAAANLSFKVEMSSKIIIRTSVKSCLLCSNSSSSSSSETTEMASSWSAR